MTRATTLATKVGSRDPEVGLQAVASLRILLEQLEEVQVSNARKRGWSWQDIAGVLGVTRQAVHHKHADRRIGRRR